MRTAIALLAVSVLLAPATLSAQAQPAQQDKDKDKKKGRTFTDADLRRMREGGTLSPPAEGTPAGEAEKKPSPAPGASKEKTPDELKADAEKAWREKAQKAEQELQQIKTQLDQVQAQVNDLSQNVYGGGRAAALNRLEELQKQLATTQASLDALREEGRRSGWR